MSILIFFIVLFILVLVHEWGHFIVAKKTGMRVDEFGIGFPPKLFGIQKGETEYTFNLLPIGGFVRIFGEDAEGESSTDTSGRSFVSKSKWAQTAVLIAGVTMNVILAWVLFIAAFSIGVQTEVSEAAATADARLLVAGVLPESPAAEAQIPPGAVITNVTATSEETLTTLYPSTFTAFIEAHSDTPVTVTYQAGGDTQEAILTPTAGIITEAPEQKAVGIALTLTENKAYPITEAIILGSQKTVEGLILITTAISGLIRDAFQLNADLSQVTGPVGIVGVVDEATAIGFTSLLLFTAFISLNLAVINLLPFPALDGGRLLFVIIEAIKGSPINPRYVQILNTAGFALLILLMIAITWNDIAQL